MAARQVELIADCLAKLILDRLYGFDLARRIYEVGKALYDMNVISFFKIAVGFDRPCYVAVGRVPTINHVQVFFVAIVFSHIPELLSQPLGHLAALFASRYCHR